MGTQENRQPESEIVPDPSPWRSLLVGVLLVVSLAGCLWIAILLLRLSQMTSIANRSWYLHETEESPVFLATALSAFAAALISESRRWIAGVGFCIAVFSVIGAYQFGSFLLVAVAVLAVALGVHWVRPMPFPGVATTLGIVVLFCLPSMCGFRASYRSPISRVRTDMRSLATAIEAYHVDNDAYPAWTVDPDKTVFWNSKVRMPTFRRLGEEGLCTLTTPIAYVPSLFPDPFRPSNDKRTFAYWVPPDGTGWILISPGPDDDFDLTLEELPGAYDPGRWSGYSEVLLSEFTYDPTNGTISGGDLWRVSQ